MTRPDKVGRLERRRDDQTIIAAIADGDLTGLGCLFERYGEDVRRYLSRLGVISFDLDDVVHRLELDLRVADPEQRARAQEVLDAHSRQTWRSCSMSCPIARARWLWRFLVSASSSATVRPRSGMNISGS